MTNFIFHRRDMFKSLLAISAVGALGACGGADEQPSTEVAANGADTSGYFTGSEMALIAAVSDTLIPTTETAGAAGAGVPETLQALATEWGNDEFRAYWRSGLDQVSAALSSDTGAGFETLSPDERLAVLSAYDAKVFDGEVEDGFYRDFKSTVVTAYYMSEVGAAEELAYEPVPGDWIGCVPLSDYPKTWAT
ncbi:MAG: gluconate 2-dehydrogenase subunit 3 family protein [Pseudomonadota bacterium]